MSNTIQVKRGVEASLPTLNAGEFGFTTDTKKLYIGDGATNYELAMSDDILTYWEEDSSGDLIPTTGGLNVGSASIPLIANVIASNIRVDDYGIIAFPVSSVESYISSPGAYNGFDIYTSRATLDLAAHNASGAITFRTGSSLSLALKIDENLDTTFYGSAYFADDECIYFGDSNDISMYQTLNFMNEFHLQPAVDEDGILSIGTYSYKWDYIQAYSTSEISAYAYSAASSYGGVYLSTAQTSLTARYDSTYLAQVLLTTTSSSCSLALKIGSTSVLLINSSGIPTFANHVIGPSSAPTTDYQLANKKYVDDEISGISGILSSWEENGTTLRPVASGYNLGDTTHLLGNSYWGDSDKLLLGDSQDLQIYHDGSDAYVSTKTGDILFLTGATPALAMTIGSSGNVAFAGEVHLGDGDDLYLGAGNDLRIWHNGTDSYVNNSTGNLIVQNLSSSNFYIDQKNASGSLILRTGSTPTTALTVDSSQISTFSGSYVQLGGSKGSFGSYDPSVYFNVNSTTEGHSVAYALYANEGTNNRRAAFFLDDTSGKTGILGTYGSGGIDFVINLVNVDVLTLNSSGDLSITGGLDIADNATVDGKLAVGTTIGNHLARLNYNVNDSSAYNGIDLVYTCEIDTGGTYYNKAMEIDRGDSYVAASQTNSGYLIGLNIAWHAANATYNAGTLNQNWAQWIQYGHYSTHANAVSTQARGLYVQSYNNSGTITNSYAISVAGTSAAGGTITGNYYGLYIDADASGAGTVNGTVYGIYVADEDQNRFTGSIRLDADGIGGVSSYISAGAADDLLLWHNGTDSYIRTITGVLVLDSKVSGGAISIRAGTGPANVLLCEEATFSCYTSTILFNSTQLYMRNDTPGDTRIYFDSGGTLSGTNLRWGLVNDYSENEFLLWGYDGTTYNVMFTCRYDDNAFDIDAEEITFINDARIIPGDGVNDDLFFGDRTSTSSYVNVWVQGSEDGTSNGLRVYPRLSASTAPADYLHMGYDGTNDFGIINAAGGGLKFMTAGSLALTLAETTLTATFGQDIKIADDNYVWLGDGLDMALYYNSTIDSGNIECSAATSFNITAKNDSSELNLGIGASPVTGLTINQGGIVTKPNHPAFLMTLSSDVSNISTATWQDLTTGGGCSITEVFDVGGDHSGGTFTAPITGKYQFNVQVRLDNLDQATTYYCELVAGGTSYRNICDANEFSSDIDYWDFQVNVLVALTASQTAYVRVYQAGGTSQTDIRSGVLYTHFSGHLVC